MADQKRGDDAADHAPKAGAADGGKPGSAPQKLPQDGANYEDKVDGGLAQPVETLNSANDE